MPLAVERKGPGASRRSFLVFTQPEVAGDDGLGYVLGRGLGVRSPRGKVRVPRQIAETGCAEAVDPSSPVTQLLHLPKDGG